MNRLTILTIALLWTQTAMSGVFGPSNLYECILEEMPGTKNNHAANEIIRTCRKEFPGASKIEKKSPIFGIKTSGECIVEYGKDISSERGANFVRNACRILYPGK